MFRNINRKFFNKKKILKKIIYFSGPHRTDNRVQSTRHHGQIDIVQRLIIVAPSGRCVRNDYPAGVVDRSSYAVCTVSDFRHRRRRIVKIAEVAVILVSVRRVRGAVYQSISVFLFG